MVYEIFRSSNDRPDILLKDYIKELNNFFEVNWVRNTPNIFIVKDRRTINDLLGRETPGWLVGWSNEKDIYLLDKENFENESNHKFNPKEYDLLLKHELVHCFCNIFYPELKRPLWLTEGLALFLSGQNKTQDIPKKLEHFIDYFEAGGEHLYDESGFAVEILVRKYGKDRLFQLLREIKRDHRKEDFERDFKDIFRIDLNYENFI